MQDKLTADEYTALAQIAKGKAHARTNACIARNSKRLNGLKYITHSKDGSLAITEKGTHELFVKDCIDALRSLSTNSTATIAANVANFLAKKGHIVPNPVAGGFDITDKGRDSLADMDANMA